MAACLRGERKPPFVAAFGTGGHLLSCDPELFPGPELGAFTKPMRFAICRDFLAAPGRGQRLPQPVHALDAIGPIGPGAQVGKDVADALG